MEDKAKEEKQNIKSEMQNSNKETEKQKSKEQTKEQEEKAKTSENTEDEKIVSSSITTESNKDMFLHIADSIYVRELSKREKILWLNATSFALTFIIAIPTFPFLGVLYGGCVILALICFFTIFEFFDDDISDIVIAKIILWSRIDFEGVTKLQKNRTKALFFIMGKKWYP